jgi:HEAT repeat protein
VISVLETELQSRSGGVRRQAAGALGSIGPGARAAIPALKAALHDPEAGVREAAAAALAAVEGN